MEPDNVYRYVTSGTDDIRDMQRNRQKGMTSYIR